MFYGSVKLWQHSVLPIWVVLYGSCGCPKSKSGGNWNPIKGAGLPRPGFQSSGVKKGLSKAHVHRDQTCSNPLFILFYSILSLCTLNKERKEALIRDCIQREQFHVCAVFLVKKQWFHILFLPTSLLLLLIPFLLFHTKI